MSGALTTAGLLASRNRGDGRIKHVIPYRCEPSVEFDLLSSEVQNLPLLLLHDIELAELFDGARFDP